MDKPSFKINGIEIIADRNIGTYKYVELSRGKLWLEKWFHFRFERKNLGHYGLRFGDAMLVSFETYAKLKEEYEERQ